MKGFNGLVESVNVYLNWNKCRVDCFLKIVLAIFIVKTVNLSEIAAAFSSGATIDSRYRRLQRFFAIFNIDFAQIACWIFGLFFKKDGKYYLVIDRTNWYWGKSKINVFVLGVCYEGMAIPLFWKLLPKAGSSHFEEQRALISLFIGQFGKNCIQGLLADREFGNGKLFKWLDNQNIHFYIRIKGNSSIKIKNQKIICANRVFNRLHAKTQMVYRMSVWVFGQKLYLVGSRSERGELMIVATNHPKPVNAIAIYLRRWEIENLFQGLKSRGFSFEETHLVHPERLEKLIAVLAIGFAWCHKIGEWKSEIKPIIWKQFKGEKRPQYSYFRYGLNFVREILINHSHKTNQLKKYFSLICPTMEAIL